MQSMYAKLFSRIAQSSLMEQDVATRYCFMMLLAISDPYGDVIGTDVAIARTVNLPLDTFKRCLADLMSPDPDSNSQAKDGRRIVESEAGRGYTIVNYLTYRAIKSEEEKKAYMREYMARRRKAQKDNDVTDVKICKNVLTDVTQSESELDTEKEEEVKAPIHSRAWLPESLRSPAFTKRWTEWEDHLRESGKPITQGTRRSLLTMCEREGEARGLDVIDLAISKGWKSLIWDQSPRHNQPAPKPRSTGIKETPMDKLLRENEEMFADGVHPDKWRAANPGKDYIKCKP
jgi:hypothetical protein